MFTIEEDIPIRPPNLYELVNEWIRGDPQRRERYIVDGRRLLGTFGKVGTPTERSVILGVIFDDEVFVVRYDPGETSLMLNAGDPDFFAKLDDLLDRVWGYVNTEGGVEQEDLT